MGVQIRPLKNYMAQSTTADSLMANQRQAIAHWLDQLAGRPNRRIICPPTEYDPFDPLDPMNDDTNYRPFDYEGVYYG